MLKLNKDLWDARDIERLRRQKADERGAAERRNSLPPAILSTPAPSLGGGGASSSSSSAPQSRILDDCDGDFFLN